MIPLLYYFQQEYESNISLLLRKLCVANAGYPTIYITYKGIKTIVSSRDKMTIFTKSVNLYKNRIK